MREAEELSEAKKQAESANAAKTEFVMNASHKLRTLVTNVVGYTNMLEKHFDDTDKSRTYLQKVETYEQELTKALDVTLEMEHIENGKS